MASTKPKKEETQKNDEVKIIEPVPDPIEGKPNMLITTKRLQPIIRSNTDRMTTDSGRFKEGS